MTDGSQNDPFSGTWVMLSQQSELAAPTPKSWIQHIAATSYEIQVSEEIITASGGRATHSVIARFDGQDYPVHGLPLVDVIAYHRTGTHSISGTGKKNGKIVLQETATVANDGCTITFKYSWRRDAAEQPETTVVFRKSHASAPVA